MTDKNNDSAFFSAPEISVRDEDEVENQLLESTEESDGEEPDSKKLRVEREQSNQSGNDEPEEVKHIELIHVTEKPAFMTLNCTFSTCSKTFKTYNQLCKHIRSYHYVVGKKCDRCPMYLETEDDLALHIGRYFLIF